jgi:hypothetical protein
MINGFGDELRPAKKAIEETYDATISTSTEITLNTATTVIEVTANAKPIFMKWGTTDASSTDWDHCIAQDSTRRFAVPVENASTGALYTAVNFIEQAATATLAVSEF